MIKNVYAEILFGWPETETVCGFRPERACVRRQERTRYRLFFKLPDYDVLPPPPAAQKHLPVQDLDGLKSVSIVT